MSDSDLFGDEETPVVTQADLRRYVITDHPKPSDGTQVCSYHSL